MPSGLKRRRVLKVKNKRQKSTRPSKRELRDFFKGIINGSDEVRAQSLSQALDWYDRSKQYLEKDPTRAKMFNTTPIRKALLEVATFRQKAVNVKHSITENEKMLRKALEFYEKAMLKTLHTKPVASTYKKYEKIQARLKDKQKRLTSRYELLFGTLYDAVNPICKLSNGRLDYAVADTTKPIGLTKDWKTMIHSKSYAANMLRLYREQGWLAVIIEEMEWLSLAAVGTYDREHDKLEVLPADLRKQTASVIKMMSNVSNYARKNPTFARRLIRAKRKTKTRRTK